MKTFHCPFRTLLTLAAALASSSSAFAQNKPGIPWDSMDLGPFHTATFRLSKLGDQTVAKGIAIKVGEKDAPAAMLFDPELMRVAAAWSGGFVQIPRGRGGLEGQTGAAGEIAFGSAYAPGWVLGAEIGDDPRPRHQGRLPSEAAKYRGLRLNGDRVVLEYTVGHTTILELPGSDLRQGQRVFTRTISTGAISKESVILIADLPGSAGKVGTDGLATVEGNAKAIAAAVFGAPKSARIESSDRGRITLKLPPLAANTTFQIAIWGGPNADLPKSVDALKPSAALANPASLAKAGPPRWGAPIETQGKLGKEEPYAMDELALPDNNPYNSWLRPGAHDFFPNGDAAVVNLSGDVWLVSGIDEKLERIKWKRFATGLFQPLGCRIVDGKIYVLGRDQITRLHDTNSDGEADYYECFNNDCVVTDNYHEFALDLQTDKAGNFYYAKGSPWTPTNMSPHQGTLLRVSKDGSKLDVIATGLRAPNGLGMGPNDLLTCSDNQGHWMPANRLNIIRPGGFYGMVPAAHKTLRFKAADGTEFDANPSSAEDRQKFKTEFWGNAQSPTPVNGYDLPLVWMPQDVDNSPGGEVWVTGGKWGPWEGRMLHLSYGHCRLYGVSMEKVEGVDQGAVIRFPFKFPSGIMRGRIHPKDGQLYLSGLNVWQSDAAKFGCFARVRYTGAPVTMAQDVRVLKDGVQLVFTGALDEKSAGDSQNYAVERWNYQWTGNYGSSDFKPGDGGKGKQPVEIGKVEVSPDKKSVKLTIPEMMPAMQMRIRLKVQSADGKPVEQDIHNTIHRVPGMKASG
jgi:hypothetical protein